MSATHTVIDANAALALRRDVYSKPAVTRGDLSMLLSQGRASGNGASPEFAELLADVASDLLVRQVDPQGYIQPDAAAWLMTQLHEGDGLSRHAEYCMLVEVIRRAVSVPPDFAAFVVAEMENAIVKGHVADGETDHAAGCVDNEDVEALRIAVFAATEGSSLHVTRASAEALFHIAHATAGSANDASFPDFFAKAVGNYLMGIAFHWTQAASQVRDEEKWLDEKPSFGSFLSAMLSGSMFSRLKSVDEAEEEDYARDNASDAREIADHARIDATEADWILAHLTRDGNLTEAEIRLLDFLNEEATEMPENLKALMGKKAA